MGKYPHGEETILIGNVNTYIADPEGITQKKEITVALVDAFLENMSSNFPLRRISWSQDVINRIMIWKGREGLSWTDYIIRTHRCLFQNLSFQEPRHNIDQYMVLGCLHGATHTEH